VYRRSFAVWVLYILTARVPLQESYLVDPASSHMLVSKIKPCMSKYKQLISVIIYLMVSSTWITVVILELIHA
jgi:hypothetical protein